MRKILYMVFFVSTLIGTAADAAQVMLFDASTGTAPAAQGWSNSRLDATPGDGLPPPSITPAIGGTTFHSIDDRRDTASVVYQLSSQLGQTINPDAYEVRFRMHVLEEFAVEPVVNRHGVSVRLTESQNYGIWLSFSETQVKAHENSAIGSAISEYGFDDEVASFDTATAPVDYVLRVINDHYALSVGGTTLLSGALRTYDAGNQVEATSALRFGDMTGLGGSRMVLGDVVLADAPVPVPAGLALMLPLTAIVLYRRCAAR